MGISTGMSAMGRRMRTDPMGLFGPRLKLFTFTFNGREYTYGFSFQGPLPVADLWSTPREDGMGTESGLIKDFADSNRGNPLGISGMFVGPAVLLDGTIFRAIHEAAGNSRAKILLRIAQGDEAETVAGVPAYGVAWVGEGFALYGALEWIGGPLRLVSFAPKSSLRPDAPIRCGRTGQLELHPSLFDFDTPMVGQGGLGARYHYGPTPTVEAISDSGVLRATDLGPPLAEVRRHG